MTSTALSKFSSLGSEWWASVLGLLLRALLGPVGRTYTHRCLSGGCDCADTPTLRTTKMLRPLVSTSRHTQGCETNFEKQ
ncbi:hypothetical protein H4582DRAFT_166993 [Lactarius indigo]|nr:hypothetical protein H4582DRAFT_166993 [Lactarius indigo]